MLISLHIPIPYVIYEIISKIADTGRQINPRLLCMVIIETSSGSTKLYINPHKFEIDK